VRFAFCHTTAVSAANRLLVAEAATAVWLKDVPRSAAKAGESKLADGHRVKTHVNLPRSRMP
jgi:hypothetical protein